ncbi:MAG: CCA tRNA nucleotidyltransferase [Alphaproteobacteria bacterium]|nr:CCA tRNA nucleotidyltransferase [Alphaproteobacteria bacterium]
MFHPEYINPKVLINNDDILQLFGLVEKHGGVLRFVGGAVRDGIAGIARSDIDLVTDMSPAEFSDMCADEGLRCVPIGIQFFTTGVIINNSFFKVTSLNSEEDNSKDEWKNDAAKRDLTINAVYADEKGNVFDYYNGIKDLENGVIKFIGNPQETIENDYIRIMRFFRFCAMFGRKIDRKSLKACIENRHLLHKVSQEKIKEELFKIIMAPYAVRALELIFKHNILDFLISAPEFLDNLAKLDNLVATLGLEKSIIRRVYVMFEPQEKRAHRLSDIFRLNKEQKKHLLNLCHAKLTLDNFKDSVSINKIIYQYGKDVCKDIWLCLNLENSDISSIRNILNTLDSSTDPVFPLQGKDLIKIGADTKFLGLYLDVLKKEWFESGCLASKDKLLEKYQEIFKYSA